MLEVYVKLDNTLWRNKIKQYQEQGYETLVISTQDPDFSMDKLSFALNNISIFDEKRIVFFQVVNEKDDKKYINDSLVDIIKLPTNSDLVINLWNKPLSKSKVLKSINDKGTLILPKKNDDFDLVLKNELKKHNIKLSFETFSALKHRLNNDTARIYEELDKLKILDREIEIRDIELLVTKELEDDIFAFSNALSNKQYDLVMKYYEDFKNRQIDPLALIGLVASNYRRNFQINLLYESRYSVNEIASLLKVSDKQVNYVVRNSNVSAKTHMKYLLFLKEVEQGIKRGLMEKYLLFELFLIEVMK